MMKIFIYHIPIRLAAPPTNEEEKIGAATPPASWAAPVVANKANPPATTGKFTAKNIHKNFIGLHSSICPFTSFTVVLARAKNWQSDKLIIIKALMIVRI